MSKRTRRTILYFLLAVAALQVLSMLVPGRSVITVSSPEGDYRIESSGRGPNHVRLELGDGAFVESGTR